MKIKSIREIIESLKRWSPIILGNFFIDLNLKKGQKKYVKFVTIGRSRTGSNFLKSLLNSHYRVISYGELFRPWNEMNHGQLDIVKYLNEKIYRKYDERFKAVGFKLFYYHAHGEYNEALWKELKKDRSIRVVHITRKNMLKTIISKYKAEKTDTWVNWRKAKKNNVKLSLSFDECKEDFEKTEKWESECRKMFKNHKVYELVYEDLEKDPNKYMNKVLNFLSLPINSLNSDTVVQRAKKISDSLENYNELKLKFQNTRWAKFFDDVD